MKRTPLKRGNKKMKRISLRKIRVKGQDETKDIKDEIQSLLRSIAIKRDGGCVLRHFSETGTCGGYTKEGKIILQFDHLNSRTHSVSYADERLGVILCLRHHLYYKKQYPAKFEECVRNQIGKERCKLLDRVRADRKAYKMDWKLERLRLIKQYEKLST